MGFVDFETFVDFVVKLESSNFECFLLRPIRGHEARRERDAPSANTIAGVGCSWVKEE